MTNKKTPSRTNGGKGPMQISAGVTLKQKKLLTEAAQAIDYPVSTLLRCLTEQAPPFNELPEPSQRIETRVNMTFHDEDFLHRINQERGEHKPGNYLRRVIEWGLTQ